ncbi:unnamed protein product, partial [Allacma fusca]
WRLVAGDLPGDTKFYGIHNLQPNTNYDIQIAAINHAGRSAMNYSFLTGAGHLGKLCFQLQGFSYFHNIL